ncbi:MAG: polysaccharide biosynthesis protein [Clostridia bacterium]|nr:polysaccharide biosynthesis protein [Clostridia bacterium]
MAKSRTQKAALNTLTAGLSEIVSLICGLILPRLILRNFGSAYNGITSSATQFLSAISILTVGVSGTTRVALYRSLKDNDIKKSSAIVRATEIYMRKIGLVLLAYILLLSVFYPIFVDTGYAWFDVAVLVLAAGVGTFGRYFFGTAYTALLSADQSLYIYNIFLIASVLLNTLISAVLIWLGCSIQVVKLGSAFVFFMRPLLQNIYVSKKYKIEKNCEPDNSALALRWEVMAHSIANIVHDNTDMMVLTLFCNVKIVSVYTVYNLVMHALKKTQAVFTNGTEAIFGSMWVKGEINKIKRSLGYYEFIVSLLVSIVFAAAFILILPFISLYTKGVKDVEYILPSYALVIMLAQAWFCIRAPYLTLVQGAGHYKQTKKGAFVEAAINLVSSIVLVQFLGIVGVAIGTLLANVFRTMQYAIYIEKNIVSRGVKTFLMKPIWAFGNAAVAYFIAEPIVRQYAYGGWVQWVICAIAVTALCTVITILSTLVFYRHDLKDIVRIGKTTIRQKMKRK